MANFGLKLSPKNLRKFGGFIYDLYIDVRN